MNAISTEVPLIHVLLNKPLHDLKQCIIEGSGPTPSFGLKPNLSEHAAMLRNEFIGKSELLLYHALLNVLMRRKIEVPTNLARFRLLWETEHDFLLNQLNSRWLISACDTIMDYFPDREEKAIALAGSSLMGVIKVYETERIIHHEGVPPEHLGTYRWSGRRELFDGLSAFSVGHGDMIYNLHHRIDEITSTSSTMAARILSELIRRVNAHNTAIHRFRKSHVNPKTMW